MQMLHFCQRGSFGTSDLLTEYIEISFDLYDVYEQNMILRYRCRKRRDGNMTFGKSNGDICTHPLTSNIKTFCDEQRSAERTLADRAKAELAVLRHV